MSLMRSIVRGLVPFGIIDLRRQAIAAKANEAAATIENARQSSRRARIQAAEGYSNGEPLDGRQYEDVLNFLQSMGVPHAHLVGGSVPKASIEYIRANCIAQMPVEHTPIALHIGNFLGVSLVTLAAHLCERNSESLILSVDPNITHRGISNPQNYVVALIAACGLSKNIAILAGYSGRKSVSNDGEVFESYDPAKEYQRESACENTLTNIAKLRTKAIDLAFFDGNHEANYLRREIEQVLPLMRPGGFVVLDDVDDCWVEIKDVFRSLPALGLTPIGSDGRVGIAVFKG